MNNIIIFIYPITSLHTKRQKSSDEQDNERILGRIPSRIEEERVRHFPAKKKVSVVFPGQAVRASRRLLSQQSQILFPALFSLCLQPPPTQPQHELTE